MSDGYTRPEALIETGWLANHLGNAQIRIVDATFCLPAMERDARAEYTESHIPGARFFDIDAIADQTSSLPHMLPSKQDFARAVGALGIGNDHKVVVYDSYGLMSAARAWWMFRVFGHDMVAILNGGLPKWRAENRQLTSDQTDVAPATFSPHFRGDLVLDGSGMRARIERSAPNVADARAADRFSGASEEVWPGRRRGHIPGSRNLPFTDLIDPVSKTLLPEDQLRRRFAEAGVAIDSPPAFTCGSGVTACVLALGAYLIGQEHGAVYDGSWAEWGLPGPLPVVP